MQNCVFESVTKNEKSKLTKKLAQKEKIKNLYFSLIVKHNMAQKYGFYCTKKF